MGCARHIHRGARLCAPQASSSHSRPRRRSSRRVPSHRPSGQGIRGPSEQPSVQAQIAVGSEFTYQGRLLDGGNLPTGTYDVRFVLYDPAASCSQVPDTAIVTKDDVTVANGRFSVTLDFGSTAFDGEERWIKLAVKPGGSGQFTVLDPAPAGDACTPGDVRSDRRKGDVSHVRRG